MAAAGLSPGERVLDVGSGTGPSLLAAGAAVGPRGRVVGIDVTPPLVERAAQRVPDHVQLIVGTPAVILIQTPLSMSSSQVSGSCSSTTRALPLPTCAGPSAPARGWSPRPGAVQIGIPGSRCRGASWTRLFRGCRAPIPRGPDHCGSAIPRLSSPPWKLPDGGREWRQSTCS